MFLVLIFLSALLSGCINKELPKRINVDAIYFDADLGDRFTANWVSSVEHGVVFSPDAETVNIKVIDSRYSYRDYCLIRLDLFIYREDKSTGFRVIFSKVKGDSLVDVSDRVSGWINRFLVAKFGKSDKVNLNEKLDSKMYEELSSKADEQGKGLSTALGGANPPEALPVDSNQPYAHLMIKS